MIIEKNKICFVSTPCLYSDVIKGNLVKKFCLDYFTEFNWLDYGSFFPDIDVTNIQKDELENFYEKHFIDQGVHQGRFLPHFNEYYHNSYDIESLAEKVDLNFFSLSSCMNPYIYAVSSFEHCKYKLGIDGSFKDFLLLQGPFLDFVKNPDNSPKMEPYLKCQSDFIFHFPRRMRVNYIVRFENNNLDMNFLTEILSVSDSSYSVCDPNHASFYTDNDCWDAAKIRYGADFDLLGYSM
jgi:hypothetical protein